MIVIKTVVLDLDGPLLDGMYLHYQCYSDILTTRGFDPIPMHQYWEIKRNRLDRWQLQLLSNSAGIYHEFLAAWMGRIETKEYIALDRLQNHVVDILRDWKKSKIYLLLTTMQNNAANLHWQLGELGIAQFLDEVVVVGRSQAGASKLAKFRPLLNDIRLNEVVWVGDTEVDIYAAREMVVEVCALPCGLRAEEYLASLLLDMNEENLSTLAEKLICQA